MNMAIGQLIVLTVDEYSDYKIFNVARIVKLFDLSLLIDHWLALHPEQTKQYFDDEGFANMLVSEGYLEIIEWYELHLGGFAELPSLKDAQA
jgi:hypothetical protein